MSREQVAGSGGTRRGAGQRSVPRIRARTRAGSRPEPVAAKDDSSSALNRVNFDAAFSDLAHLVALSSTGKTKAVIAGMIEASLAATGGLADADAVAAVVRDRLQVAVDFQEVQVALSDLMIDGRVIRDLGRGMLVLTPQASASIAERTASALALEGAVRAQWLDVTRAEAGLSGVTDDMLWGAICGYLRRVYRQYGALGAQMIDAGIPAAEIDNASSLRMLKAASDEAGLTVECIGPLRAAVRSFATAPSAELRRYLLGLLDATFTLYALSVPASTARYLREGLGDLDVFLDTNILFDIVGLHPDNPTTSTRVLVFIRENAFPFNLWVHERTVREFRGTLDACKSRITSRHYSPALSSAMLQTLDLPAVDRRYHELNAEAPIDPATFIDRYYDVPELIRPYGVKIWRESDRDDEAAYVRAKGELFAEYEAFLTSGREEGTKTYHVLDHDMTVWLATREFHHDGATALDSGSLLLTNDTWLHRFDWRVLRRDGPPTVVLPAQLLQVLRPFSKIGRDADDAFLAGLAAPDLLVARVDFTETTQHLLSVLATYRDLPTETAAAVLRNQLVTAQLQNVSIDGDEARELVDAAVVMENRRLVEEHQARDEQLAALRGELEIERAATAQALSDRDVLLRSTEEALTLAQRTAEQVRERASREVKAQRDLAERESAEKEDLRKRLSAEVSARGELTTTVEGLAAETARRRARARLIGRGTVLGVAVVLAVLVLVLPDLLHWTSILRADHRKRLQVLIAIVIAGLGYVVAGPKSHRREVWWGFVVVAAIAAITLVGN